MASESEIRAERAGAALHDEILKEAFQKVFDEYQQNLLDCSQKDDLGRFRFSEAMNILAKVEAHLHFAIDDANFASDEINPRRGLLKILQ